MSSQHPPPPLPPRIKTKQKHEVKVGDDLTRSVRTIKVAISKHNIQPLRVVFSSQKVGNENNFELFCSAIQPNNRSDFSLPNRMLSESYGCPQDVI